MLQALSLEDKRIKVIDQINSGVSQASNNGLKNASGKYIGFVDADDYNGLAKCFNTMVNNNELYNKFLSLSQERSKLFTYDKAVKSYLEILK